MSKFYEVVSSFKDKCIRHDVMEAGIPEPVAHRYIAMRMGMTFPSDNGQGAFCVIGQEMPDKMEHNPEGPLHLLDEHVHQGLSLDEFFNKATDSYSLLCCSDLYCDTSNQPMHTGLLDFLDRAKINYVTIYDAPYRDSFYGGLAVCHDWWKAGKLILHPDSLTRLQLRGITKEDLKNDPWVKFPLVDCLRHVLSGYKKYPPSPPMLMGAYGSFRDAGWML